MKKRIRGNEMLLILILALFSYGDLNAQQLRSLEYKMNGMTIAVTNMEQMLDFYSNVFKIEFTKEELYEAKLYSGIWGDLNLLFCPAEIAKNTAKQNRHQFDIVVSDLNKIIKLTMKYGGELIGRITEDEYSWNIGIYDPDRNSILFKQLKK